MHISGINVFATVANHVCYVLGIVHEKKKIIPSITAMYNS
jgi:hypothetical protein